MRIPKLGIEDDAPTVVVLGAGASRGASFVTRGGLLPPLDADFFDQVQRMPLSDLTSDDRRLLEFIHEEFGLAGFPTLETFFTQVEAVDRFHHEFNIKGRVSQKFRKHLTTLRRLIPRVFLGALEGRECIYHRRLAGALRAGDAVLSFNYDCLIDEALRREAAKRWRSETGYGFKVKSGQELWDSPPGIGAPYKNPIKLLKPHGSLNWALDLDKKEVELVNAYDRAAQQSIVPPTWDKSEVAKWPWNDVWRESRRALAQARLMVVVGYSVPITDQLSQALLRADVNNLRGLVIVNPDELSRSRVKSLFSSAVSSTSAIVELSTLAEFADHLPMAPTEDPPIDVAKTLAELEKRLANAMVMVDDLASYTEEHELALDDVKDSIDEVRNSVDDVGAEVPEFKDEIGRIEGMIWDLEARIQSIPL